MLQKPSQRTKAKDHAKYLLTRVEKWKNGELKELLHEGNEIQKRMLKNFKRTEESNRKAFCRLMLAGKVRQATKFIDSSDPVNGIHELSEVILEALRKHPRGEEPHPDVMMDITKPLPNPVIYEHITAEVIQKCGRELSGSGGPTLVDADHWKYFLNSRAYGQLSYNLADAVSGLAKRLCTENVHPDLL